MELPVVTTDAMGCRESIREGITGLQVPLGDVKALQASLKRLVDDSALRKEMGRNGRRFVETEFPEEAVFKMMHAQLIEVASS